MVAAPQLGERGLVSIILATYNERSHILHTIAGIREHLPAPLEIIVVDDDSEDETWRIVEEARVPNVKLIRRVATRGLASAFMRGIIESRGEVVGWMDADMCMPPSLLSVMIDKLKGADVVVGSRYVPGGLDERSWPRRYASELVNRFASLVLGYGIRDYDSGFVVVRRSVFDKVSIIPTGYGAYFIEFLYHCCRKGLNVQEVPYTFRDRTEGTSKSFTSISRFARLGAGYLLRIVWARCRRID
jgi:dolichol-phosphate mannosyltransferase